MASAELACFSEQLQGTQPVISVDKFQEFIRSSTTGASGEIQERAVKLFSSHNRQPQQPTPFDTIGSSHEQENAKRWLSWARDSSGPLHQFIRPNEHAIPEGIMPAGCHGAKLVDFRVNVPKKSEDGRRRRGPFTDDAVYAEHKELRDKLARGNAFLEYSATDALAGADQSPTGGSHRQVCAVYGLRKFTGGLGDDDEDLNDKPDEQDDVAAAAAAAAAADGGDASAADQLPRWANFFSASLTEVKSVVATAKANGEAAHYAARYLHDRWLFFAGSKNVHLVFSKRSDLDLYSGGQFSMAKDVAHAICDALDRMEAEKCLMFQSFLACTGFTAIFELLHPQHQHVESLSHLSGSQLQFICWSSFLDSFNDVCVGALDPMLCYHMAKGFGLDPVDCKDLALEDLDAYLNKIRIDHGREGDVLYFLDVDRCPVGLLKRKTIWYVCIRAIRQKTKTCLSKHDKKGKKKESREVQAPVKLAAEGRAMEGMFKRIENRFEEIARWLEFGDECRQRWLDLALGFVRHVLDGVADGSVDRDNVNNRFPEVWNDYLKATGRTDHIEASLPPCTAAALVFRS